MPLANQRRGTSRARVCVLIDTRHLSSSQTAFINAHFINITLKGAQHGVVYADVKLIGGDMRGDRSGQGHIGGIVEYTVDIYMKSCAVVHPCNVIPLPGHGRCFRPHIVPRHGSFQGKFELVIQLAVLYPKLARPTVAIGDDVGPLVARAGVNAPANPG